MDTPTPNQSQVPVPGQTPGPESPGINQGETVQPQVSPEVAPVAPEVKPEMAPEPSKEQAGAVPSSSQPVQPQATPKDDNGQIVEDNDQVQAVKEGFVEPGDIENKYVKAADDVIDKLEEKPFEEEEAHEDLQISYLKERFGKELKKSEDE